jgi:hypothetical protein
MLSTLRQLIATGGLMAALQLPCNNHTSEGPKQKQWKDYTKAQRTAIIGAATIQLTLMAAAQIDITRRPAGEIRGSKLLWRILTLVNFIGPLAYFAFGRKRPATTPEDSEEEREISVA